MSLIGEGYDPYYTFDEECNRPVDIAISHNNVRALFVIFHSEELVEKGFIEESEGE